VKVRLMLRDDDFAIDRPLRWNAQPLIDDLGLEPLVQAMASGDELVRDVARVALLGSGDRDAVAYRQPIVVDTLANPVDVRAFYALASEAVECRRKHFFLGLRSHYASSMLYDARELMQSFTVLLRRLRDLAAACAPRFSSEGFSAFFEMLARELDDAYLAEVDARLTALAFTDGIPVGASLGPGNGGRDYVLREPRPDERSWWRRTFVKPAGYSYRLPDRDDAAARELGELRDRAIRSVAIALVEAAEHVESFFRMLRTELAFHIGCANLKDRLDALGVSTCLPDPRATGTHATNLCDASLAISSNRPPVPSSLDTDGKSLVIITGANQGGKSTFLRGLGIAQLMMQCGMFVAAESFAGEPCTTLATHYRREEDPKLEHGKLDEELARMSEIVDHLRPGALLLLNESFAATNEREGSELARQVISALLAKSIRVVFVTHLHAFARSWFDRTRASAVFLRAQRTDDGGRTFRIVEGEPLATSHANDVYRRIFGAAV
jgi:hypothetical protein